MGVNYLLPHGFSQCLWRTVLTSLLCLMNLANAAQAATPKTLESVYLYSSPITSAFFSANGTSYDGLKQRWREYFRPYGKSFREISRANLMAGLKPGILVLGSAALLDEQERKAIELFANSGGSILMTWGTGVRNGRGQWAGYGFIEGLLQMKVKGQLLSEDKSERTTRFLNPFGDGPLTWAVPAGQRIFLGEVAETPIRVESANLAARYFSWERYPAPKNGNGAIAFLEKGTSRRVYFGFSESSWEYDERIEIPNLIDSVMAWLKHETSIYKAAWPSGATSAQLVEMDAEEKYSNALDFSRELSANNLRGTFYSLTSVSRQYRSAVEKLSESHEIGYHGEVHVGFKGKTLEAQEKRLNVMVTEMRDTVGTRALPTVTGFRAPTESWDPNTEKILRKLGVRHNVTGPSASEGRLPFFSESEPGLKTEDVMVGLPRTQMDDLNYLGLRLSAAKVSELTLLDFDYLHETGALGVWSVHSQNYEPGDLMTKVTPPYLRMLQQHHDDIWTAPGREIADWWRVRDRVVYRPVKGVDASFAFDVRAPGNVKGITFIVTHPAMDVAPKAITAAEKNLPLPELKRLDAYRSVLIFRQELKAGNYAYSLDF
ncbi:MAG: polysaccharide deacetylase family protein [Comamonadaceae bacterium]